MSPRSFLLGRKSSLYTRTSATKMAKTVMFLRSIVLILSLTLCIAQELSKNHAKGYCIWYDQCPTGGEQLNCFYNGPAKNLTDPKGVQILNKLCPELRGQRTCCSTKQLVALDKSLQTMIQLTSRCPACWNNVRRLYCQLTCSPDQSLFTDPNFVLPGPEDRGAIWRLDYFVSPQFKQGLFDSCKDVTVEGYNVKLFCGVTVAHEKPQCTPEGLLYYMQSSESGFSPYDFDVRFPEVLPRNLSWMNETTFRCNEPFIDPQTNKTASVCSCQDCVTSCPVRKEQLIITATHPTPTGYHRYGDGKWIPFGPIFHLELLNQALDLQNAITNLKVPFEDSSITFEDICFKPTGHLPFVTPVTDRCEIQSIFQYFQNDKTKLNKCLTSMGYNCSDKSILDFKAADFHDHLLCCASYPELAFDKILKEPCIGAFGGPVDPRLVLDGFPGNVYHNATTVMITFAVNNYQDKSKLAEVMTWEKAFKEYMEDYVNNTSHANLTISYFTPEINSEDEVYSSVQVI